jgi:pyruvate formate lyase activating enzyme
MIASDTDLKEAVLWQPTGQDNKVQCGLCNWRCIIDDDKAGHCRVRKNTAGVLYSLNYGRICAANPDPIEKKPLFHFQPGSRSFSIATMGCNFRCEFCQNWQISQSVYERDYIDGHFASPEQIVQWAIRDGCKSIAYTYTEPTIFMELCSDCGKLAKEHGLKNVFVSNGYMTVEALDFAAGWLDAINVDLKAFTEDYYKHMCKARLQPVKDTISYIAKNTTIWQEITTLLVPDENDSPDELKQLADFLVTSAGPDVPWHISRFYPQYKYTDSVPTPLETLERAYEIGKSAGLHYVYMGNVPGSQTENTYCYKCGKLLIERMGYQIIANKIKDSKCPGCGTKIDGVDL